MSDRDDIDVVISADDPAGLQINEEADGEAAGSDTIRQNTPSNSAKTGLLSFLKKAFSTDDEEDEDDSRESEPINNGENPFAGLLNRFKKTKDAPENVEDDAPYTETDSGVSAADSEAETPEIKEDRPEDGREQTDTAVTADPETEQTAEDEIPDDEEEYLMISAFLEGEEYVPIDADDDAVLVDFETDDENEPVNGGETDDAVTEISVDRENEDVQTQTEEAPAEGDLIAEIPADVEETDNSAGEAAESSAPDENDNDSAESGNNAVGGEEEKSVVEKIEEPKTEEVAENGEADAEVQNSDSDDAEPKAEELSEISVDGSDDEDEDEEFVFEDEMLFDEGDDEAAEIAKLDGIDEYGELSTIFSDTEENLEAAEPVPDTKEYGADERLAEPLDIGSDEDEKPNAESESESETIEEENDTAETSEDKTEEKVSDNTEDTQDAPVQDEPQKIEQAEDGAAAQAPDENAEKEDVGEDKEAEKEEPVPQAEEKTDNNGTDPEQSDDFTGEEKPADTPKKSAQVKQFFGRVRSKLSELWNAKNEEEKTADEIDDFIEPVNEEDQGWVKGSLSNAESAESGSAPASEQTSAEESTDSKEETSETDGDINEKTSDEENTEDTVDEPEKTEDTAEKEEPQGLRISVIKNENVTSSEFDAEKLRGQLNVIERDDTDVLTDEQKRELEMNKKVLERVAAFEEQNEARREELRRESQEREAKAETGAVNPITELEITNYRPAGSLFVKFTAGRFSESVKSEYECIINYRRMRSVSTKEALKEALSDTPAENKDSSEKKRTEMPDIRESKNPVLREARDFDRNHDKVDSIGRKLDYQDERNPEPIEYRSEDDAIEVKKYLANNRKRDSWVFGATAALTVISFLFSCFARGFTVGAGADASYAAQRVFALINFLFFAGTVFCCKDLILGGLMPLKKFKANSDTGVAAASAAAALQSLLAIIAPKSFMSQGLNIYTTIVMLTLTAFCFGRYMNSDRINANFRFVSDTSQKYAGKFFPDPRMVAKLLSGTRNDKTELCFQKKTTFLKHFVKLSNAEDPGDKLAYSFSLPTIIIAIAAALIAGIMSKNFFDAISVLTVVLCAGIPISSRALCSFPINRLAKRSLLNKSMIVGVSAVDTFSESAAVMIDAKDLYPEGSIQMNDFKALDNYRWQDGLYAAAAVTIASGGAMSGMFDSIVDKGGKDKIPTAEGVMYEDGKGLLGWVNNERVLVGNRSLLTAHGVTAPSDKDDNSYRAGGDEPLYIAMGGRLVGVIIVGYTANHRVSDVLKKMEASDMSLLIRTTDVNITAERISRDFGVGLRNIKVLEQKSSNFIRDEMIGKERSSPAFIATKGGVTSFGLAVSECIQTKRNVSLSTAVEIVGALIKLFIVTVIVLFAGIHQIGAIQLFLFSLFWVAAVLCAPIVVQKIQQRF